MTTSSVTVGSPKEYKPETQTLVSVVIKYPSDYNKPKFFKDGDIKEVAAETAETFISIGIATLKTDEAASENKDGDIKEVAKHKKSKN